MESETEVQRPENRVPAIQRIWATEGYWEDELMQFAVEPKPDDESCEPWQEMDRPLATTDF